MTKPLLDHAVFIVEQKRKFFEMRNQYRIFDESGTQIGAVEQTKQSPLVFLARLGSDLDVALPVTLEVTDATGQTVLVLQKPWLRMTLEVSYPDGRHIGSIRKRLQLGKARFTLSDQTGAELGQVQAQNWRARDFSVADRSGMQVAQVMKKWRGLGTEMFTDADTYAVNLQPHATEPLRSLALGAALAIDVIMKQKDY